MRSKYGARDNLDKPFVDVQIGDMTITKCPWFVADEGIGVLTDATIIMVPYSETAERLEFTKEEEKKEEADGAKKK